MSLQSLIQGDEVISKVHRPAAPARRLEIPLVPALPSWRGVASETEHCASHANFPSDRYHISTNPLHRYHSESGMCLALGGSLDLLLKSPDLPIGQHKSIPLQLMLFFLSWAQPIYHVPNHEAQIEQQHP